MFPTRDDSDYKDNKIWTDICWSVPDIPKSWLTTKFALAMDTVPFPERWITFIPDNENYESFAGNYYAAGFGTNSMEEHKKVIKCLSEMKRKDRFAFTHIVVIDARTSVVGQNIDKYKCLPFLVNHQILRDRRIHRNPEDGPDDEHYIHNTKINAIGSIQIKKEHIGFRKYTIIKCRESNMKDDTFLKYCCNKDHKVSQDGSYYDRMSTVHQSHISWLLKQKEIPRECYISLILTYQTDILLDRRKENRMVKILKKKCAIFERTLYDVGSAPPEWHDLTFNQKMNAIYDDHQNWLLKQSYINHVHHCRLSKIYENDPFISEDRRKLLSNIITTKFGSYLAILHDEPKSLTKDAAHRYWIEKIPVVKPVMGPVIPFDCW